MIIDNEFKGFLEFYKEKIHKTYPNRIDWDTLNSKDWNNLSRRIDILMTEYLGTFDIEFYNKFIDAHANKLLWKSICCKPYLSFNIIEKNMNRFSSQDINNISVYQSITYEFIIKNIDVLNINYILDSTDHQLTKKEIEYLKTLQKMIY